MTRAAKSFIGALGFFITVFAFLVMIPGPADAKTYEKKECRNIVIIGDRVVDIAYNLGVVPTGMSARCSLWPLCSKINATSQPLGCPGCLSKGKRGKLASFIKSHRIKLAIVENSHPYCILAPHANPLDSVEFLKKHGVEVKIVDFGRGIVSAIAQTAEILDKQQSGKALTAKYIKAIKKFEKKNGGLKLGKRVVVLHGIYQAQTSKAFIQVEAPGGYTDRFILGPLGCKNVGKALVSPGKKPTKGRWTIRKLKGLAKAKPDIIVITGDSASVQKALAAAIANQPALCGIPVYSLPLYIDSSVIERPLIVGKWAWALK